MRFTGVLAIMLVLLCAGAASATSRQPPLLGANFIRFDETPPHCGGPSIVDYYDRPGVRTVHSNSRAWRRGDARDAPDLLPRLPGSA